LALRIEPAYGYGWYSAEGGLLETPPPFRIGGQFDGLVVLGGPVVETDHPLAGLWVVLSIRTDGPTPAYNVRAYPGACRDRSEASPCVTGFALLARD